MVLVLLMAAICGPSFALGGAQEEPEAVQEEETGVPDEERAVLEEIVVTAQKRAENQKDVPVSVSTLGTEELELLTTGGVDVRFLSARVPSVHIESSFGRAFPRFYIRGLGNTDFDLNASQPVSLVYDEVVLENPVVKGMPIWDLDRIEVLRGPQGTLFGRNTPAGIVKFESKKPSQEFDSFVRFSYGTYDTIDLKAALGGPLTETLSARFSGLFQSRSDWVDNEFTGENDALGGYQTGAFRLQFLWEPNAKFSGLLNLHGWDVDGTARLFRANIIEAGTNNTVAGFEQDKLSHDGLNSQDIEARGGVLKLEHDFGAATLTSVTGYETLEMYSRGDIDGGFGAVFAPPSGPGFIPFPSESADGLPDLDQVTQELRVTSNDGDRFNWLVGAFYFEEDMRAETFSYNTLGGNVQDGFAFQEQTAEAWALFGSVDLQASEKWILKAGLRFSHDEKDFSAERPDPTFNTPTVAPITTSTDADFTSWDVSATYKVNPDVNVYGRLATSFRAPSIQGRILFCADFEGGTNPATNCISVADEEEILSGEIGIKSELLDRKLRLNLTGFSYEVDGQQIVAVGGIYNTATLLNADKTKGYGFETDLEVAPNSKWLMTFGLSYNKTEIQDADLSVAPCGGGCTILDPIGPNGVLVDGNSLPHAPEWTFNGIIDYRAPVGSGLFIGTLDWAYHDEKRFFLYESQEFRTDGLEFGLRLGYTFSEAKYEFALFGRNITDEVVVRNGIDFNNLTGMTNDPAIWGLEFVARF
ncbi:MAG: TonB-dependent receptor [bacterium]|nr:TonB-dependent receptor [bacterium]